MISTKRPDAWRIPVLTAAPLPLLYGWRITCAPAAAARSPVPSLDPSSITTISCHDEAARNAVTTSPMAATSLNAGMITVVSAVGVGGMSGGEAEVDHVSVLHDVLLAFEAHFAVVAAGRHRSAGDECIVCHDLGADEPAGDVAVNLAGGDLRLGPARNRPRAAFIVADGKKRHVAEQIVTGADDPIEPRLRKS